MPATPGPQSIRRVLVVADSLAFHGPQSPAPLSDPRLWPNVMAEELGAAVDWSVGLGWTARDAWWALTKDPVVYSLLIPRADAVVLALGGMDHLPAMVPTYLREGLSYLRPGSLRRSVKRVYHRLHPYGVRLTGGRMRVLPQAATDAYLTRCVEALRIVRPGIPVVGIVPSPYRSAYHGGLDATHAPAVDAHRAWGARMGVPLLDLDALIAPYAHAGELNADGMHWCWEAHADVGRSAARILGPG